jgi:mono/diheme cytochrome c family protein
MASASSQLDILVAVSKAYVLFSLWTTALAAQTVSYQKEIAPILNQRCVACHQAGNPSGGFVAESVAGLAEAARSGLLLDTLTGERPRMPKAGKPLSAQQVTLIRRWIEQGAKDDSAGEREAWWSLRPLPPARPGAIDDFIRAKLKEAALAPSREADRRTLIRRVTFDLHGLPPSPDEVDAFAADPNPRAYENLVDRLLQSPRYGERWARHWLDVVHYGDSHGYDKDKPRPNAWPYRDAVIRALNDDMPYPRFIRAQIAGDVLFPDDPHAFALTGFLAAGPWDFVGHQELKPRAPPTRTSPACSIATTWSPPPSPLSPA